MGDQFLMIVEKIIKDNLENENFSVEILADKSGVSRSVLHRKLKKLTGKSATDLIIETRLQHAKELLENDIATISEISFKVGFNDPSYFNKVFKKHFGVPPGKIRKKDILSSDYPSHTAQSGIYSEAKSKKRSILSGILIVFMIGIVSGSMIFFIPGLAGNKSEKSIAVLPFQNLTGQPENDFFIDGIHDALIGELGQFQSLRVISRTSTIPYRYSEKLLKDIATELSVNTIAEGSISGAGDSLRMIVQLIDVFPKERHLLTKEYQDAMENALVIQSKIVKDVANNINLKLSQSEEKLFKKSRKINPEIYRVYLSGMHELNKGTHDSYRRGIEYLGEAIDMDPGDPLAYAGLAIGYATMGHGLMDASRYFRSAKVAADKALILDPGLDEAYTALAIVYVYGDWSWALAEDAFKKAISINPNNEFAHAHYAWYHSLSGNLDEAIYHSDISVEINPLSSLNSAYLAWFYYLNNDNNMAEKWARRALELEENDPFGNLVLGWIYLDNNQHDEALELHEKLPDNSARWKWCRCRTYVITGRQEKAEAMWKEMKTHPEIWYNPFYNGMIAGVLGYSDEAFDYLNEAYENKYFPTSLINIFPSTDYLRDDPRFDELIRKMNFPQ
jgi:AraC-like DNA-binding protein/TolB-like protein